MTSCCIEDCDNRLYAKGYCQKHYQRVLKYDDPNGGHTHAPPEVRFWRFVDKRGPSECWLYRRYGNENYGRFSIGPRGAASVLAHRFSYEMHVGPIPSGMLVMHTCDQPFCVNPAHLKLGTPRENTADMMRKGRHAGGKLKGADVGSAKLTPDLVRLIRASPMYHAEIGRVLGVTAQTIRAVRSGQTWAHVT